MYIDIYIYICIYIKYESDLFWYVTTWRLIEVYRCFIPVDVGSRIL